MKGSVRVIEELMKFDRTGVISARNRVTEATALQLAAEGGHADVVKVLVRAGASCTDENKVNWQQLKMCVQIIFSKVSTLIQLFWSFFQSSIFTLINKMS